MLTASISSPTPSSSFFRAHQKGVTCDADVKRSNVSLHTKRERKRNCRKVVAFNVCLAASVVIVAFKCAVFTSGSERKAKYSNSETKESKIADINGY